MGNYARNTYHSEKAVWRTAQHSPRGKRVGIELELEHSKGYKRLLELLPDTKGIRPSTERDGSLTENGGLEIIFPPYTYSGIRRKDSYFRKALAELAVDPPRFTTHTGMHMNINTTGWSVDAKKMFVAFLHCVPLDMLHTLGGRRPNNYSRIRYIPWSNMDSCIKHDLAWIRPNRIEVRFPAATIDADKVMNLITFFDLVEQFVRTPGRNMWFNAIQKKVRYGLEWYMEYRKPAGFDEMSNKLWAQFKEFVNAKRKTKPIKEFLASIA